jgi:hypothetical protein
MKTGLQQKAEQTGFNLVLWARLELARLAPLPPQDSVSTNSTTRAMITSVYS